MNRPSPVKPDNVFILIFNALRSRRVPLVLRIASHSLLLVALAMVIYAWVMGMQFKQAMQQQADALGQALITQTAASATELLVSNDILSLNVLLGNLAKNPLVAHAAIYSVDNRILAEAGTRPTRSMLGETEGLYSTPITFQEVIAGQLRISLDMGQFQQPMTISLQSMAILSLILLALSLSLSMRLGRHISTPLLQLRLWLRDPDDPAPGAGRNDEIGDLARQLQARLVPEHAPAQAPASDDPRVEDEDLVTLTPQRDDVSAAMNEDEPLQPWPEAIEPEDPFAELREEVETETQPSGAIELASAVLAIQLGAQEQLRRLPRTRLLDLLERYRACLEQAAALYQGRLHTLKDGSSLMLFHERECGEDYLTHAICCGELMRALGHALQIEVADSGITLQLQLGLALGSGLETLGQAELLLSDSALDALALSQHSRNLLLVDQRVAQDDLARQRARIRPIASPEGASCVERLLDPYPALLERQLARMHDNRA
ncbi:AhpA/YtjB family protein [Pseudomonas sp. NCCP-436]|uniref:AhpA/YtjB family protein n=1 Tax=Pseudomonas sp. NCCP-436 TaxID=2842481 RepID=UPI001C823215|nr:AhpA/YtjB family protein [Pseudomonas sp. NCCP-436]GIZ12858.1 hypothetical protein NCCP436_22740 [Pseudomonas sp. NCCP-436]